MKPPRMVSRQWIRRYLQPRKRDGTFEQGWLLWTREWLDGKARWLYFPEPSEPDCWPGPR